MGNHIHQKKSHNEERRKKVLINLVIVTVTIVIVVVLVVFAVLVVVLLYISNNKVNHNMQPGVYPRSPSKEEAGHPVIEQRHSKCVLVLLS